MSEMFDLAQKRLVWIPVEFPAFVSNGDELATRKTWKVEVQVDLVDTDEFERLFSTPFEADGETPKADASEERVKGWASIDDTVRATRVINNWRKVASGGNSIPFSADALAKMMKVPNFPLAFFKAFAATWQGKEEVRSGNSDASAANGQAAESVQA